MILHKACRRYRELATAAPVYHDQEDMHQDWDGSSRSSFVPSAASTARGRGVPGVGGNGVGGNGGIAGGGVPSSDCVGEFDQSVQAVKVAKASAKLLVKALNTPQVPTPVHADPAESFQVLPAPSLPVACSAVGGGVGSSAGGGGGDGDGDGDDREPGGGGRYEKVMRRRAKSRRREAKERAEVAIKLASSQSFAEAVRESLVRSPSDELRGEAMTVLERLAEIDEEAEVEQELEDEEAAVAMLGCVGDASSRNRSSDWAGRGGGRRESDEDASGGVVVTVTTVLVSVPEGPGFPEPMELECAWAWLLILMLASSVLSASMGRGSGREGWGWGGELRLRWVVSHPLAIARFPRDLLFDGSRRRFSVGGVSW